MRILPLCFAVIIAFASCSKKDDIVTTPDPIDPTVPMPDTLSAGFTVDASLGNKTFTDVFFTSNDVGYLAANGAFYKTANGGVTWQPIPVEAGTNVASIGAWPGGNVAYTAMNSFVNSSTDGFTANSRRQEYFTPGGNVGFYDCFYPSQNKLYLSSGRYFWRSNDAGVTIDTLYNFGTNSGSSSIYFINDNLGWIIRGEGVYKTTNGGASWTQKVSGSLNYALIHFVNANIGFYSANNVVYKTTDGGDTWTPVYMSLPDSGLPGWYQDIAFLDSNNGYISDGRLLLKTTDGGATWTKLLRLGNPRIIEIHFTDVNHGWVVGTNLLVKFSQ